MSMVNNLVKNQVYTDDHAGETIPGSIEETLKERGSRYGEFKSHAVLSQNLKSIMQSCKGYQDMTSDKREALEMIQHKIARILNGSPDYHDNWHDISGYATLVADTLEP
jgi:hypothetical protein